ncbi:type II toxin-antitoxin system HicA family toxin [Pararoseomonas sp. SCSIO 73927]|uniref:type II toxin-antitoxin system HicA family toxin n=1 Tax=Pararoseomonas sp. SCSIO 73927 TaxID=3114537 RepID=UPI0030D400D6
MRTKDVIRMVEADGWVWVASKGSHRQYRHPSKPGRVTISFHGGNEEVHPKTLASIGQQSGLNLKGK